MTFSVNLAIFLVVLLVVEVEVSLATAEVLAEDSDV